MEHHNGVRCVHSPLGLGFVSVVRVCEPLVGKESLVFVLVKEVRHGHKQDRVDLSRFLAVHLGELRHHGGAENVRGEPDVVLVVEVVLVEVVVAAGIKVVVPPVVVVVHTRGVEAVVVVHWGLVVSPHRVGGVVVSFDADALVVASSSFFRRRFFLAVFPVAFFAMAIFLFAILLLPLFRIFVVVVSMKIVLKVSPFGLVVYSTATIHDVVSVDLQQPPVIGWWWCLLLLLLLMMLFFVVLFVRKPMDHVIVLGIGILLLRRVVDDALLLLLLFLLVAVVNDCLLVARRSVVLSVPPLGQPLDVLLVLSQQTRRDAPEDRFVGRVPGSVRILKIRVVRIVGPFVVGPESLPAIPRRFFFLAAFAFVFAFVFSGPFRGPRRLAGFLGAALGFLRGLFGLVRVDAQRLIDGGLDPLAPDVQAGDLRLQKVSVVPALAAGGFAHLEANRVDSPVVVRENGVENAVPVGIGNHRAGLKGARFEQEREFQVLDESLGEKTTEVVTASASRGGGGRRC
mmetsp:Transcript_23300/g.64649  ORF Transcript_23300/g.64649 Transcript_23300/m.64649 type:complete len:512 (+) Transcript_23300:1739-3274(+)